MNIDLREFVIKTNKKGFLHHNTEMLEANRSTMRLLNTTDSLQ